MSDRPPPLVPAYPDQMGGLRMWCCWCGKWHYHSPHDLNGKEYGHRAAHCHRTDSPYRDNGYVLTRPEAIEMRR